MMEAYFSDYSAPDYWTYLSGSTNLYIALFTADPKSYFILANEVQDVNYGQKWFGTPVTTTNSITNSVLMTWDVLTTNQVITHIGVMDNTTPGNMHIYAELPVPIVWNMPNKLYFKPGTLTFILNVGA